MKSILNYVQFFIVLIFLTFSYQASAQVVPEVKCSGSYRGKFLEEYGVNKIPVGTTFTGTIEIVIDTLKDIEPLPDAGLYILNPDSKITFDTRHHGSLEGRLQYVATQHGKIRKSSSIKIQLGEVPRGTLGGTSQTLKTQMAPTFHHTEDPEYLTNSNFPTEFEPGKGWLGFEKINVALEGSAGNAVTVEDFKLNCVPEKEPDSPSADVCGEVAADSGILYEELKPSSFSNKTRYGCRYSSDAAKAVAETSFRVYCPADEKIVFPGFLIRTDSKLEAPTQVHVGTIVQEYSNNREGATLSFFLSQKDKPLDIYVFAFCEEE